ncbi:MAG: hypothetical protein B7Z37_07245 [Verrucomicrobia bacterium 12-59-8]|nr:MAG: hypothetical protein B7Z37_07245 [Verrucomicrobia bacterium 12-59-8]
MGAPHPSTSHLSPRPAGSMSATDLYFTAPLALLHSGTSALDVLERCLSCGIVNAGIGYRKIHGEAAFQEKLAKASAETEAQGEDLPTVHPLDATPSSLEAALVGAPIVGVLGGSRATDAILYCQNHQPGAVFFRLRADWMWNALHTTRADHGEEAEDSMVFKPLSWREFRILAAILSAKVNTYGFTFLGWESIQARACGFHSKALFQAGKASLPAHCQPMSRHDIRRGLDRLEALGFYARCRYATGKRGGLMAYSFRHPKREGLVAAIQQWATANQVFQAKTTALRAADLAAFAKPKPKPQVTPQAGVLPSPGPSHNVSFRPQEPPPRPCRYP